ncbi:MAG TPA: PQQ-binding-like beta-propeller repeat protein [Chthoniobacterales bacterium]|nr:PQQ-binding-like beta-propeller repeat protein [Chthoniobacterales bacterium]
MTTIARTFFCAGSLVLLNATLIVAAVQGETVTEKWLKQFNPSSGTDFPIGTTVDSSANVIVCGVQQPNGASKGFVTKYAAADGAILWSVSPAIPGQIPAATANGDVIVTSNSSLGPLTITRYAGTDGHVVWETTGPSATAPKAMKLDAAGNVVVTGPLQNDLGFDGDRPYPIHNYYTAKYSGADGHLLWEKQYNGPENYDDIPAGLALDGNGNVVVTGESQDFKGRPEIYTVKYDGTDGHVLWERRYNGPNAFNYDRGRGVTLDPSGDVLVAGQGDDDKLYLAKYGGVDGHVLWERLIPYPGGGTLHGNDVVTDARGNAIVTAYAATNHTSFFVGKYRSSDGGTIWQKPYLPASGSGGAELHGLALDSAGNIVTAGSFTVLNTDRNDAYLGKLSTADGAVIWEKTYDGAAHLDETTAERVPFAIAPDGSIGLAIASSLGGQNYESVTIKYAVSGASAGGSRNLWTAGKDLLTNEDPDDAAETAATNVDTPQWSYGYRSVAASTALTLFTPQQHVNDPSGLQGWVAPGQATLGVNTTDHSITFNTGSGNYKPLLPGQIYLSPGSGNELLVVRWTAPAAGDYRVLARWVDLDDHGGDGAGCQLVVNGDVLFSETFESTPTKAGRARLRAKLLRLNAGDIVDFVLAPRATPSFDATAFNAVIKQVPRVTITSPASGSELTGDVTFNVNVQHSQPIESVYLFFDDQSVGIGNNNNPYSIKAAPKPGYHEVRAVVTDSTGAVAESPKIAVIIKKPQAQQKASKTETAGPDLILPSPGILRKSVKSGDWHDDSVWEPAGRPTNSDSLIIQSGHEITVDNVALASDLTINGKLGSLSAGRPSITVFGTCHLNGQLENVVLHIATSGRLLNINGTAKLRFVALSNFGRMTIQATEFDGEGTTITNSGTIKAHVPLASQEELVVPVSSYEQKAGSTVFGPNTTLKAPAGVRIGGGTYQAAPGYRPLIGNDGNTLIGMDGNTLIGNDGNTLIGNAGGTLISDNGAALISENGLGLLSDGGGGLIGNDGNTLLGPDGLPLIGMDGNTLIGNAGGTIQPASADSVDLASAGGIILTGGTITGTGELRGDVLNQGAFIVPGNSPGGLVVIGNYTQEAGGTLVLEMGGKTFFNNFSYDVFQVSGNATLGGNLVVKTINGFTPAPGDNINPLLYGSHTGNFASITPNAQVNLGAKGAQMTTDGTNPQGPRALNISTRLQIQGGDNALFAGFIITGPSGSTKKVLIRGLGPSLAQSGVSGAIPDPFLELHSSGATVTNDNWQQAPNANEIPNGFAPGNPNESVIIATLGPGNYSAILKGAHGETGVGLAEVYDLDPNSAAQLANIATRGFVQTGDNVLIGGFIVSGNQPAKVLVRAIGSSLSAFGVQGALQDTTLEVHDSNGGVISNDNWGDSDGAAILDTTIPPSHPNEAAVFAILVPGNYTAIVRGADDTTGIAVVEAYNLSQ